MSTPPTMPVLDSLEWSAVAVALQDAARCGCAVAPDHPGPFRRIAKALFGSRRPTGLADPRLEAVRRFTCQTRRRRRPASELAPALASHGYTAAQIDALALLSV